MYRTIRKAGLPRFEHLYLIDCPERSRSCKAGIGYDVEVRLASLRASFKEKGMNVTLRQRLAVPVLFPRFTEGMLHIFLDKTRLYKRDKWCAERKVSGFTEWFKYYNWVCCALFLLIPCFSRTWADGTYAWLGWFFASALVLRRNYPMDFYLFVVIVAASQYLLVFGAILGALWWSIFVYG